MMRTVLKTGMMIILGTAVTAMTWGCAGPKWIRLKRQALTQTPTATATVTASPTAERTATPSITAAPTVEPTPFPAIPAGVMAQADKVQAMDCSVSGIRLRDRAGARRHLGTAFRRLEWYDGQGAQFFNETEDQLLCLFENPGDQPGLFREYRVTWRFREQDRHIPVWKGRRAFVTGKGIRVGMAPQDVIAILGRPQSVEEFHVRPDQHSEIHHYLHILRDPEAGLDYIYGASYVYSKGVLVEFSASLIPQKAGTYGL